MKIYLVKEHQLRKRKRIFKSWILLHQYEKDRNKGLNNILCNIQSKHKKRHLFSVWRSQTNKANKCELEQQNQLLRNDINNCISKIDSLTEYIKEIDDKKLNITDFDEART